MNKLGSRALLACLVGGMAVAAGCGDDDSPGDGGKGGSSGAAQGGSATGGKDSSGGTTSTGGKGSTTGGKGSTTGGTTGEGGATSEGGSTTEGGTTGEGGSTTEGGTTSEGGTSSEGGMGGSGTPDACDIYATRTIEDLPVDTDGNLDIGTAKSLTLTHDKTWRINGRVYVPSGVTLTIEPCTLIVGTVKPNPGTLFIMRGAKLIADGTPEAPIVFSSPDNKFHANAPWGGVVLLGKAPIGASDATSTATPERIFEGLTDVRATYGGAVPADNSGSLSYVRIEYGGDIIVADKEVNGLTLGGVGSGTSLHHIMVKRQMDDCFEFFGGTVDADHLICENTGDDMFDTDEKYTGHLQYLFGRLTTQGTSADPNGFEWDGNQPNFATVTERGTPQASNATLCGLGVKGAAAAYGAVLRRGLLEGTSLVNTIITGFDNGVDTRDAVGTNAAPLISWTHSLFFGQNTNNVAIATEATDNDNAFDEKAWILDAANSNTDATAAPAGFDCYANPPKPFPNAVIAGGAPAAPFEAAATYVGAFKNAADNWMTGAWVDWSSGNL